MNAQTEKGAKDPVVEELDTAIFAFLLVKQRYPILVATATEIDRLRSRSDVRGAGNRAANQIMRDSFDMLVIDLYSVRERLTQKDGLFHLLKQDPARLSPAPSTAPDSDLANLVTAQVRQAATRLDGTDQPATLAMVESLYARFMKDTKPLDEDRNRVRAHRYQQKRDTSDLFIVLPDVQGQIDIVRRYLGDLYLVITHKGHSMDLADSSGHLAEDMADIIVHGSINGACNYYGLPRKTEENPTPWYWYARKETLERATGHPDVCDVR